MDDLAAVLAAVERGESVIAVNGSKKPWYPWKRYQETRATADEVRAWAKDRRCSGFAVVTGAISGLVVARLRRRGRGRALRTARSSSPTSRPRAAAVTSAFGIRASRSRRRTAR